MFLQPVKELLADEHRQQIVVCQRALNVRFKISPYFDFAFGEFRKFFINPFTQPGNQLIELIQNLYISVFETKLIG